MSFNFLRFGESGMVDIDISRTGRCINTCRLVGNHASAKAGQVATNKGETTSPAGDVAGKKGAPCRRLDFGQRRMKHYQFF